MAVWLGWLAVALIAISAAVPLGYRVVRKRRAAPDSAPIRRHVMLGVGTSAIVFAHTLFAVPGLGSEAAVGGGFAGLAAGVLAFFFLVAHAGLGLQLRDPRLRDRVKKRRSHVMTAIGIAIVVAVHVGALLLGSD